MARATITYSRNTTYAFTHIYQKNGVDSTDGVTLFFTVKETEFDDDTDDSTAIIAKDFAMSGATTEITIDPEDVSDSIDAGTYYYDIKIKEADGPPKVIYQAASGTFILTAGPTNRES